MTTPQPTNPTPQPDPPVVPSLVPGMNVALGRVVSAHRKRLGYSQAQVAKALKVPLRSVEQLEDGAYPCSLSQLFRLAHLYGLPVWGLMSSVQTELLLVQEEADLPPFTDDLKLIQAYGTMKAREARARITASAVEARTAAARRVVAKKAAPAKKTGGKK